MKIQKADEVADFTSHLGDIDNIFFESSAKWDFCNEEEKQSFREMSRRAGTQPRARVLARVQSAIQNDSGSSQGPAGVLRGILSLR